MRRNRLTEDDIAGEVAEFLDMPKDQVAAALDRAAAVLREKVRDGAEVTWDGWGVFNLSKKKTPEGVYAFVKFTPDCRNKFKPGGPL